MKRLLVLVACVIALTETAGSSRASVIVHANQASFSAASTNLTEVNFVGLAPPNGYTYYGNNLATGGLTFNSAGGALFVVDPGYDVFWSYTSNRPVLTDNFGFGAGLTTTLPAGTTAVAFLLGDFFATTATITLSTGDVFNLNLTGVPNLNFIGFTSDVAITSVTMQDGIGAIVVDSVQFGQAIPEPATLAVFGVMAAGAFGFRRRMKAAPVN